MSGKGVVGAALPQGELQLMKVPNYTGYISPHLFPVRQGACIQVEEGGRRNSKSGRISSTKGLRLSCEKNKLLWAQSAPPVL